MCSYQKRGGLKNSAEKSLIIKALYGWSLLVKA